MRDFGSVVSRLCGAALDADYQPKELRLSPLARDMLRMWMHSAEFYGHDGRRDGPEKFLALEIIVEWSAADGRCPPGVDGGEAVALLPVRVCVGALDERGRWRYFEEASK